ncbi:MAG: alpha-hydroxy-acid oxidizing enzyme [Acidimicrobiales bacterium MED-G01]|nr:MAG: alpha-hydroxy-acid oxidizing enzyme [Acidimicrobiales bacterium MED-G01]
MGMFSTLRSVVRFRTYERDRTLRKLSKAADVGDLRTLAKKRMPAGCFDYIDGAAQDEVTAANNVSSYKNYYFRPRVLRDVAAINTTTTLLGGQIPFPVMIAPTGFDRIAHSQGELAVARAAKRAGIPYSLSTMGTRSIEEVAEVNDGRKWFQVYVWRDKPLLKEMLERAAASGYEGIMITVDTAVLGRRERDVRRGFSLPPKVGLETIIDGIRHPRWTSDFLRAEPIQFANVKGSSAVGDGSTPVTLSDYINSQFDPALSWSDIEWFRNNWSGMIMIKGVQTVEDAEIAADMKLDGVILSNHGGRQLDYAPAPIDLVAPVADAVGDRTSIICDGGVRRGSDIVKAVAMGADACMIGRAYFYALGAAGERGVDWVLEFLRAGVEHTMALSGVGSIDDLDRDLIEVRS